MADSTVQFSEASKAVLRRLDNASTVVRTVLIAVLNRENQITVGYIQRVYLSKRGPDTLGVRTNRLRSSLWASEARIIGGVLTASIGSNVVYFGVHEYGFDGMIQVRGHHRITSYITQTTGGGKVFDSATGRIKTQRKKEITLVGGTTEVRAYTRHAHYAERKPIRRGLTDRLPNYIRSIEQGIALFATEGRS